MNAVGAGPSRTARFLATHQINPEMMEWKPSLVRNATPDEISDVVGLLAGEASMFTSDQVPRVDVLYPGNR
jgi:hypothetical protein